MATTLAHNLGGVAETPRELACRLDVHSATAMRSGFRELVSRGATGPIEIAVGYSGSDGRMLISDGALRKGVGRACP